MPDIFFCPGADPVDRNVLTLVLRVDPQGTPAERAVYALGMSAYEGDRVFYVLPTDAWAERRLEGDTLTVDIMTYTSWLGELVAGVADPADFDPLPGPNPGECVLLRRSATVDPVEYARADGATLVFGAPADMPVEQVIAAMYAEEDWPIILGPRRDQPIESSNQPIEPPTV
ncbi:hypothetical protein [Streptosporangium sp. NPDC000396]|uniref:hypothetical protein n=1 Tax=Streptosporangium sp. NPDC000396 TaxID=3366185 RepID=UPI0036CBA735